MSTPYDAVLLIAFGGASSPEEIRPFLQRVTQGLRIPSERLEEVAHHYEAVGGKSPLNEITFRQAAAVRAALAAANIQIPVYAAFRNAAPFLESMGGKPRLGPVQQAAQAGIEDAFEQDVDRLT